MSIEILRPNATGQMENIPAETPDSAVHWGLVDEAVSDGDTTRIRAANRDIAYFYDLYNIPDHSVGSGTISKITVKFNCGNLKTTPYRASCRATIYTHTTQYYGNEKTLSGSSYAVYSQEYTTNPNTSSAWTWDEIDALEIGVGLRGAHDVEWKGTVCTQVWVEVDYITYTLHEKTLTDGINIGEALIKNPIKVLSDGVTLTDTLVKELYKVLSDGIAVGESLTGYKLMVKTLSDGIAVGESLTKEIHKVLSDGIQFTDVLIKTSVKLLIDGIAVGESLIKLTVKVLVDGITVGEVLVKSIGKVLSDGIKFHDFLLKWRWLTPVRILKPLRLWQPKRTTEL